MKLLITEPLGFHEDSLKKLHNFFDIDLGPFSRNELKEVIHLYDGLIIRLNHYFDKELLSFTKVLKFIASPTTGLNHIDISFAKELNIKIIDQVQFLKMLDKTS